MLSKKVNLSFDPRLAVHINKDGLTPQLETLTTVSAPITENLSWYALFQTYSTSGSLGDIGVNGGIVYKLNPKHKGRAKLSQKVRYRRNARQTVFRDDFCGKNGNSLRQKNPLYRRKNAHRTTQGSLVSPLYILF